MPAPTRSLVSSSLLLALLAVGCTKSEGEAEPKAAEAEAKPEEATPETKVAEKVEEKPAETPQAGEGGSPALAAAVQSIVEEQASYPVELDPLLDLVPAGSEEFIVIRDLDDLLAAGDATMVAIAPALQQIAALAEADGEVGAKADVEKVLDGFEAVKLALRGPEFDMDKGLAAGDVGEDPVVIYGTSKPDALPTLLRSLGATGDDYPAYCKAVDGAEGYAVCADTEEVLAKYAPGKDAATLRSKVAKHVSEGVLADANALMRMGDTESQRGAIALTTTPGLVHMTMGLPDVPDGADKMLGAGPSPALGLAAPGSAFTWVQLDPKGIEEQAKGAPFMLTNVLGKLTGEIFLGNLAGTNALAGLVGVTDPGPAGGLVALAGTQLDQIPPSLPDGTKVTAAMETVTLGGASTQALHVTLEPTKGKEVFDAMGLSPEGWLFAGGKYAGVVFGADKTALETIGAYAGTDVSPEVAKELPKPLAQGMVDRTVSVAMHVSLDGLQSPKVAESFASVAKEIPTSDLPPGMTPEGVMTMVRSLVAPISGLSLWVAPPKDGVEIHMAVSLIGDPRTEEGKAALEAMSAVATGGDPASLYGGLATRFPSSDRLLAYQARAGTRLDGAMASSAILGVAAAVAVPAFLLYGTRVEEAKMDAGMMAPPAVAPAMPMAETKRAE